jgi:CheY-like chemotaxis protein
MPEMDGLEATRRIRKSASLAAQPRIVAMTANVLHGDRERCLDAGMDDYISKPVKLDSLARVLSDCQRELTVPTVLTAASECSPGDQGISVDPAVLARLAAEVGVEAMAELLDTMISDTSRLLSGLQAALDQADPAELRHWAHTIKSNAMTVGANELAQQFQALEQITDSQSVTAAAWEVTTAQSDYRQMIAIVRKLADAGQRRGDSAAIA